MNWPMVQLEKIADISGGSTPRRNHPEYWNGDIPWVTPTDLPVPSRGIADILDTTDRITEEGLGSCAANLLPVGTVIFSSRATIGKIGIARVPLTTNQGFASFIPKKGVDSKYLAYALQYYTAEIAMLGGSTTFKEVRRGALRKYKLPLPVPSEQRRIVEILDQADALRKRRAEADAKADRILPALFHKMFGDPASRPMGWRQAPLGKMLRKSNGALQSGPFGSQLHNYDFVENEAVLAVGIDNVYDKGFTWGRGRRITEDKYKELKKFTLEPGDVLITIMGTVGRTCVFPDWAGRAICTKHVYRIQVDPNQLNPEYLAASIRFSLSVRLQLGTSVTGQIVAGITSRDLKALRLDVPPIELQESYAEIKESVDKSRRTTKKSGEEFDRLFKVLLNRAFNGDLTAKWRESYMNELLAEMEEQAKALDVNLKDRSGLDVRSKKRSRRKRSK